MAVESPVAYLLLLTCVTATCAINLQTTTQCHIRQYTLRANKSSSSYGQCWDDIAVYSCWGRCDSSEIPDFKIPYKISHHPVCTYGRVRERLVRLSHCDAGNPDRMYAVIDAVSCNCKVCNSQYTSCETLNG
ncbi:hypothetical protein ScPMuIL_013829 [Solemya velum]